MNQLVHFETSFGLVELLADFTLKVARLTVKVLMTHQMGLFEETLITLVTAEASILNVVCLFVIQKVHFLEELLLTDLTTKLRLLGMHLTMREQSARRLQHLSAYITFLLSRLRCFRL